MKTVVGEVDLVVFDWSGVISDDRKPVYEANMRILARYGKPRILYENWWAALKMTLREFLESQGIVLTQQEVNQVFLECYDEVFQSGVTPSIYPEVPQILEKLRQWGVKLAVVSAHPLFNLEREAEIYKIRDYFLLMKGWSTAYKAPSIRATCRHLDVSPLKTIYVGDMVLDIRSAKAAKVHSVAVVRKENTSYHSREALQKENPEILVSSLDEMLKKIGAYA